MKRLLIALALCLVAVAAHAATRSHKTHLREAPAHRTFDDVNEAGPGHPALKSSSAMVVRQDDGTLLYSKNANAVVPIASITKLMTAMVVLDAKLPLGQHITVSTDDIDDIKGTHSRLRVGSRLTREDMLRIALMASENRAASALSRAYPGGTRAFVAAMNEKAMQLGMYRSHFVDSTGLSSENVSTARDLVAMVRAAYGYPLIREFTTQPEYAVEIVGGRMLKYRNSNRLVRNDDWDIGLSKTGYISEAGRCLVMQTVISATPLVIVLLDSWGRLTRIGDANRIRKWIEGSGLRPVAARP
ncbi:MAG TPA: D-alanyl-D-alanine endopeptidase [Burkholderiales bacterium]|nr:D-alanyl-D-alanine endopeptidase [Burkholderiales bacterium]